MIIYHYHYSSYHPHSLNTRNTYCLDCYKHLCLIVYRLQHGAVLSGCWLLYFVFTDLSALSLEDVDSVSEADRDTLAPLPPPHWNNQYPYSTNPSAYLPPNLSYIPPYSYTSTDSQSYIGSFVDGEKSMVSGMTGLTAGAGGAGGGNNSAGSVHSASGKLLHEKHANSSFGQIIFKSYCFVFHFFRTP